MKQVLPRLFSPVAPRSIGTAHQHSRSTIYCLSTPAFILTSSFTDFHLHRATLDHLHMKLSTYFGPCIVSCANHHQHCHCMVRHVKQLRLETHARMLQRQQSSAHSITADLKFTLCHISSPSFYDAVFIRFR